MIGAGISFDNVLNEQKTRNAPDKGRQKNNFKSTAKKRNRKDRVAQSSLVAVQLKDSLTDSNEDPQPEFGGVAIVVKSQEHLSPQTISWLG